MRPVAASPRSANLALNAVSLPRVAGLGLRHEHARFWRGEDSNAALEIGFAEIHAENFMMDGGPDLALLDAVAQNYPVSVHGVALSLGGAERPDQEHLRALKKVLARCNAASFSEHLAWSSHEGTYFNDLLPLAYTGADLARVADNIAETQDFLGRPLLLENPALYLSFENSDWDEIDFLIELTRRTGCGLLLDINNVVVSAANLGFDPHSYIARFPLHLVGEIHVAGHDLIHTSAGRPLLIDGHGAPVSDLVWSLLAKVLESAGPLPVLLERDNDIPPIAELQPEVSRIQQLLCEATNRQEEHHAVAI